MKAAQLASLNSLITSNGGTHLSIYIDNSHRSAEQSLQQIRKAIAEAREFTRSVMSDSEFESWIRPIQKLLDQPHIIQRISGNIGLFRSLKAFRILQIPVDVEDLTVVATSYHVKPILKWIQLSQDYLVLGVSDHSVALCQGNYQTMTLIDELVFDNVAPHNSQISAWLGRWLKSDDWAARPRLYVVGKGPLAQKIHQQIEYSQLFPQIIACHFEVADAGFAMRALQGQLTGEAKEKLRQALLDYYDQSERRQARRNIFQIAKAAVQGRIKKLIIADRLKIFGKMNRTTGGLALHPAHLDHEDDDILDDLAQTVLRSGGEVLVAEPEEIPKGFPALAILKGESSASA